VRANVTERRAAVSMRKFRRDRAACPSEKQKQMARAGVASPAMLLARLTRTGNNACTCAFATCDRHNPDRDITFETELCCVRQIVMLCSETTIRLGADA
jgi:hypothetical protein